MEGVKEDGNCVILHDDPPLPQEIHPQCFLQKYCLKYDAQPQNICRPNTDVNLFVNIFSLSSSFQRRQLIRKTWTNSIYFAKHDFFRYVFLLGYEGSHADRNILQEAEKYNEIVVIDIADSFCHLTLKGVAGLCIAKSLCPQARFVMKTDDDIFVNMFLLQKILRNMVISGQTTKVLMGLVHNRPFTFRMGKYAVSKLQYPYVLYPPFCSGSGHIMSMDVDKTLYHFAMKDERKVILHLDDPYFTGILANRAGLKHIQIGDMYNYDGTLSFHRHLSNDELNRYLILHIHGGVNTDMHSSSQVCINLWDRLVQLNKRK